MTKKTNTQTLALIPLRHGVVLPGGISTIPVGRQRTRAMAREVKPGDKVVIGVQKDPKLEEPSIADLHPIAVLATVKDSLDRGVRGFVLVVDAQQRVQLRTLKQQQPYWLVDIEPLPAEENDLEGESAALAESLLRYIHDLTPDERSLHQSLAKIQDPGLLADRIASWVEAEQPRKLLVLLELDVTLRLNLVAELLKEAKARAELRHRVDSKVRKELSKAQREAMLRQQLRAIQQELGEEDSDGFDSLRKKIEEAKLPEEAQKAAERELKRLEGMSAQQAEANVIRTYLEWLSELPWSKRAQAQQDIDAMETALEADHYGLSEVKKRILEHMAVLKLSAGAGRGTILCLVGPPGVGKTSLAQSIADATGRPLARVSLGGVRDEAEVRGHRRTYVGALPGRIITALRRVGVKNPVMVLDEIDKLGRGWAGDPEAALLEVLDPEQNGTFIDHYVEVPFDLSEVLFIATANELSTLSPPLRDRLEVIEITGYTSEEKEMIAQRHLLPKQIKAHGLQQSGVELEEKALAVMIHDYTREAGVRQLQRQIAKICRSLALAQAREQGKKSGKRKSAPLVVDESKVRAVLGKPKFIKDSAEALDSAGVAAGLAWTPVGGDILYVETTRMPGKGKVEITGQLGEVMNESAKAALAYLRSQADELGIDPAFIEKNDIHIHVPAGAVPKDGPSAGVTMMTALASLLTGRKVRSDVAMTGEITLRGRVLPVGGIKSKILAAHRAGFNTVILPERNDSDLDELPQTVRDSLEIHLVSDMKRVLEIALEPDTVLEPGGSDSNKGHAGGKDQQHNALA